MRFSVISSTLATAWALIATASDVTEVDQAPRIVGGHFATDSKFNYIAYIRAASPNYEGGICTGSLIAPNVVLTAAHCTMVNKTLDYKLSEYQVGFDHTVPGANESFTGYSVKSIVTHPKFDRKSLLNDVALFFLEDSIASNIAKTVKIYYGDYYSDTPLVAAGYGITDPQKQGSIATQLMEVNLFVGSNDFCKANDNHFNSETKLCTDGTGGIDTCAGDSGGPLATPVDHDVDFALLGLTSFGAVTPSNPKGECAKAGSTGFYTRLSAFLDWIASTANLKVDDISISNRTQHGASASASSSGASASAAASSSPSSASGSEGSATAQSTKTASKASPTAGSSSTTAQGTASPPVSSTKANASSRISVCGRALYLASLGAAIFLFA